MSVSALSIGDLINSTLRDIEKDNVAQTQKYSEYGLTSWLMADKKKAVGPALEFDIRVRESGGARFVDLYEATPNTVVNVMVKAQSAWSHQEEKVHWDEKELDMNADDAAIYDMLQERYNAAIESLHNLNEDTLPFTPQTQADTKTIRGLSYHVRPLAIGVSDPVGGFNGIAATFGDGTTDTSWCTVTNGTSLDRNLPENSRLRNFVGTYSGDVDGNFIKLLRTAQNRTGFKRLAGMTGNVPMGACALVMSEDMEELHEDFVNRRDTEGGGKDSAPITGTTNRGCKIIRCASLNSVAHQPVYGLRRDCISARILAGRWFKRKKAINDRHQTEVWTVPIVSSMALRPNNPRGLFVLHKVRAA